MMIWLNIVAIGVDVGDVVVGDVVGVVSDVVVVVGDVVVSSATFR